MPTVGEVVAEWRQKQVPKMSRGDLAKRVGTTRQSIDNLENGVAGKPRDYLVKLARVMGYARSDDLLAGLPPPEDVVAHRLSHQAPTMLQTVTWEAIVRGDQLPEVFILAAPDDALAPGVRAGQEIIWSKSKAPRLGSPILVRDKDGGVHMRRMHEGERPGHFIAKPRNDAYRTLDSEQHGLTILAVWHGKIGDYED